MTPWSDGGERVAVLGIGSVGTLLTYFLNKVGIEPVLIHRSTEFTFPVLKDLQSGEATIVRGRPARLNELADRSLEVVFLATKAYDAPPAAYGILRKLRREGVVVATQNGLGTFETVKSFVGGGRALALVLNCGVHRAEPGKAVFVGCSESFLGPSTVDKADEVAEILSFMPLNVVAEIDQFRWLKLCVNAAINPVTSLLRARNGVVLTNPSAHYLALKAVKECEAVGKAVGIVFPRDPVGELWRVASATKDNYSSMLQDILRGRRTEVDFINGAVVSRGVLVGVDVAVNRSLWHLVKELEGFHYD